ncbi:hypothetical protein J7643_19895, partial [bacterium]|nr:hypothetical protein [bacterium]
MKITKPSNSTLLLRALCAVSIAMGVGTLGCAIPGNLMPGAGLDGETALNQQFGAVKLSFRSDDYQAQATKADIKQLRVTLTGDSLASPLVQTAAFNNGAEFSFKDLKAGVIAVKIEALDAAGSNIGTANKSGVSVLAGQLTTVSLALKLNPTTVDPNTGLVGIGVTITDGDIVTTPLPTPSPTPAPTATPEPVPPLGT